MRNILAPLALVATAMAQGVTETIVPPGAAPAECNANMSGQYELTVDAIAPSLKKRQEPVTNTLLITLKDGVLKDRYNRVGYIASNRQFQFDLPPQAGALITGGWTLCPNGFLALGPSQVFWRCLSGEFYNLYDQTLGSHCSQIHLVASQARPEVVSEVPIAGTSASSTAGAPVQTSPAATMPTSTTVNGASALSSVASELSTSAASLSSAASSASASPSVSVGGDSGLSGNGIPAGASVGAPVDPAAQNAGTSIRLGATAMSSFAAVLALAAMIVI